MLSSFFIAFREGLEVALILGVVLINLSQLKRKELNQSLYLGVLTGLALVAMVGVVGFDEASFLSQNSEVFSGTMLLLAAAMIAYFIAWVSTETIHLGKQVRTSLGSELSKYSLAILGFVTVFRDGLELIVFNLAKNSVGLGNFAAGTFLGIITAVALTYVVFRGSLKLNINLIFKILGYVLIYFGAEMFAEGVIALISKGDEAYETALLILYAVPVLYIFIRKDLAKLTYKHTS